jgi:hypothetical protein
MKETALKLSSATVAILKNFNNIYSQLLIRPGNYLRTITPTEDIIVSAKVEETFTATAGINDLSKFIGALSLFNSPDIIFDENYFTISEGRNTLRYTYAAENMIKAGIDEDLEVDRVVTFSLTAADLKSITQAMGVLKHTELAIIGDGATLTVEGVNLKDPTSDTYQINVGETDKTFKIYLHRDTLKVVPRDYQVSLTRDGCVEFKAEDITYWIGIHTDSQEGDL